MDTLEPQSPWRRVASKWVLCAFGLFFAMFETIVINSWFTGKPQDGSLYCFGVNLLLLGIPAITLPTREYRHKYLSRCALFTSLVAIAALFLLLSKVNAIRESGGQAVDVAVGPTLMVLAVQLVLSIGYLLTAGLGSEAPPAPEPKTQQEKDGKTKNLVTGVFFLLLAAGNFITAEMGYMPNTRGRWISFGFFMLVAVINLLAGLGFPLTSKDAEAAAASSDEADSETGPKGASSISIPDGVAYLFIIISLIVGFYIYDRFFKSY